MSAHFFPRLFVTTAVLSLALLLSACSGRVGTETIRSSIVSGNTTPLLEKMRKTHDSYQELVTALNLARLYQLEGQWRMSIAAFDEALVLLEEYENRAVLSVRNMAAGAGTFLLARGAQSYYGTGYERSLLHTFNALNYLMVSDFSGAAVEMRKMELRQELWLQESQARLEQNLEKLRESNARSVTPFGGLPLQYSMRTMLDDPAVRRLLNNYQDSFSYALSSIVCRLAGDERHAEVSLRRATALDDGAKDMFAAAWARPVPPPAPAVPQTRLRKAGFVKQKPSAQPALYAEPAQAEPYVPPLPRTAENETSLSPTQEVTVIAFTGLAPALRIEHIRIRFPMIGYLLIDLPSYAGAVRGATPYAFCSAGNELPLYPLLHTELLTYRTLSDEVRLEIAAAVSRGMIRAGVAAAAGIAAASNKDTRDFAPLAGLMATALIDLFTTPFSASARNWETLPNNGYLALAQVARGSTVTVRTGGVEHEVPLPEKSRGVIIMATQLSNANLRVQYVAY